MNHIITSEAVNVALNHIDVKIQVNNIVDVHERFCNVNFSAKLLLALCCQHMTPSFCSLFSCVQLWLTACAGSALRTRLCHHFLGTASKTECSCTTNDVK